MEQFIKYWAILENHYYGINGPAIKYSTRNICADSTAKMLEELARILFPDEQIEIYVIPAKDWCHQDSFWIKNKDALITWTIVAIAWAVFIIPWQISQIITDASTRRLNESQIQVNQTQKELNELQINELKFSTKQAIPSNNITDEQFGKVISSQEIKKQKNQHFQQLQKDTDIQKEQIIAKQNDRIIFDKTIESIEFPNYVEDVQITITTKTIEKIHNLTVIKPVNDDQYKDLMWIVEDPHRKLKFSVHMSDEGFYRMYLGNIFWLKTLTARVRYTIDEDDEWTIYVKNKEIILVYRYNDIEYNPLPMWENIYSAPLDFWYIKDDEYVIINKTQRSKDLSSIENQGSIFDLM